MSYEQKNALLELINENMQQDNYHHSDVMNVYFDNDNFDLIIQSIDRPIFKEKLRARSYGGYDRVFIEIKTKIKKADDEHFHFTAEVSVSPTFFAWIFEFGGRIKILGPQHVRDGYRELLQKAMG